MEKKVSIVVPVYNAEENLSFCLDSILNQTYKNIQIVVVNDGSTDSSADIIERYKEKYPDIFKVIIKENSGVSDTRNLGIKEADGYYLMFSDNDDYMEPDFIEALVKADEGYDIIISGYKRVKYSGEVLFDVKLKDKPLSPFIKLAGWSNLYNTEFVKKNNLKFLKTAIGEDLYFSICAYSKTEKIKILPIIGYHWMFNENSVSNTDHKVLNRTDELIDTLNTIKNAVDYKNNDIIEYFYIKTAIYYILFSCKGASKKQIKEAYCKLFDWLKKNTSKKNKYITLFRDYGELTNVKIIIWGFRILQKLGLAELAVWVYSKL